MPHPMPCMKQRQVSADHNRRVQIRFHQNMSHHGRCSGLSMSARDADRILVGLHDFAPGLGSLKHGNTSSASSCNLRIVIMGSCGADNTVCTFDIFCMVANCNRYALFLQLLGRRRCAHIRTRYFHAHSFQHKTQRAHGYPANTNQMHMLTGHQVFGNFLVFKHTRQIPRMKIFA